MCKISIIMPVYKAEPYLDRTVSSVINQQYSDFELLLVDDGSPDKSGTMCDEWAKKDSRIKAFHKTNGGTSDARNYGLEKAEGEYITFIDCDDFVLPNWLKDMITIAEETDADIVKIGTYLVPETDENGAPVSIGNLFNTFKPVGTIRFGNMIQNAYQYHKNLLSYNGYRCVWNQLVKAEIHKKCFFPAGHLCEDYNIFFQLLDYAEKIQFTDKIGYCWVQRSGSQFSSMSNLLITDTIADHLRHHNIFLSRYNDIASAQETVCAAVNMFFNHLVSTKNNDSSTPDTSKNVWAQLYPVTKQYNMKALLSSVMYMQYKVYSISDKLYYLIIRLKEHFF
ncbi:MAG: glycosyltransferase family 2 protein [Oscillospiraceae bacterium]|nr:glycosyltransferase family 2 protein [Oscillospiraceae bacterium]